MLGGGQPKGDVEGQPKGLDRFDNLAPLAAGVLEVELEALPESTSAEEATQIAGHSAVLVKGYLLGHLGGQSVCACLYV